MSMEIILSSCGNNIDAYSDKVESGLENADNVLNKNSKLLQPLDNDVDMVVLCFIFSTCRIVLQDQSDWK